MCEIFFLICFKSIWGISKKSYSAVGRWSVADRLPTGCPVPYKNFQIIKIFWGLKGDCRCWRMIGACSAIHWRPLTTGCRSFWLAKGFRCNSDNLLLTKMLEQPVSDHWKPFVDFKNLSRTSDTQLPNRGCKKGWRKVGDRSSLIHDQGLTLGLFKMIFVYFVARNWPKRSSCEQYQVSINWKYNWIELLVYKCPKNFHFLNIHTFRNQAMEIKIGVFYISAKHAQLIW